MSGPIYDQGTPQAVDTGADTQPEFLTNFQLLNQYFSNDHVQFGNSVEIAYNTNPMLIQATNHGLQTGDTITIYNLKGGPPESPTLWPINGNTYTITFFNQVGFTIPVDATNLSIYPPYIFFSGNYTSTVYNYGFHKKTTLNNVLDAPPSNPLSGSAYYSKSLNNVANIGGVELFYNNAATEDQITSFQQTVGVGSGFKTPWGTIINYGQFTSPFVDVGGTSGSFKFPVPYNTFGSVILSPVYSRSSYTALSRFNVYASATNTDLTFSVNANLPDGSHPTFQIPIFYFAVGS